MNGRQPMVKLIVAARARTITTITMLSTLEKLFIYSLLLQSSLAFAPSGSYLNHVQEGTVLKSTTNLKSGVGVCGAPGLE
jgi:hypothetical protein